jgi:hypothetical protein
MDLVYSWQFAPGSMMTIVWKKQIYNRNEDASISYGRNFLDVIALPQTNSFSIRLLYFLDYISFKKAFNAHVRDAGNTRHRAHM